jgi:ABC-type sugar transport system substrate-binding protein
MHYVKAFEKRSAGAVLLSNGQHIPVSNRRKEGFIKGLQQFF